MMEDLLRQLPDSADAPTKPGWFLAFAALLAACFARPFGDMAVFAIDSDLFSYVLLVPFISGYLAWVRWKGLAQTAGGARWPAALFAAAGLGLIVVAWRGAPVGGVAGSADVLAAEMLSFCCLLWSGGFLLLGTRTMRGMAFPALFLVFMAPIPWAVVQSLETALQHASAELSYRLIGLSGIPMNRSGMDFHMPRIALSVGQECSGIRSTLVLFLSSLVAGDLFLRRVWTRGVLASIVIPLGIARNAVRILVLAVLCVRVDPSYIHSPIHHKGGPIFFVLSLVPFGVVLLCLWGLERRIRGNRGRPRWS